MLALYKYSHSCVCVHKSHVESDVYNDSDHRKFEIGKLQYIHIYSIYLCVYICTHIHIYSIYMCIYTQLSNTYVYIGNIYIYIYTHAMFVNQFARPGAGGYGSLPDW